MSTYTDRTHLVADSLMELHQFVFSLGLNQCWFEGVAKKHPHYDLRNKNKSLLICPKTKKTYLDKCLEAGTRLVSSRELLIISKSMPMQVRSINSGPPVYPRLSTNSLVMVKGQQYRVHFWNGSRKYEFTHQEDPAQNRWKTEDEVAELITLKRLLVLEDSVG